MITAWHSPPAFPALAPGRVHVWLAPLGEARAAAGRLLANLTPDDEARAAQFGSPPRAENWRLARAILRALLARYTGAAARDLAFQLGPEGKPALARPPGTGLHFNLSHSGDYAALAFTRAGEVGVDIEVVRAEMPRRDDVARRFFAPGEWRELQNCADPARGFFEIWTAKEAFVKARGRGVFSGLDQFEVAQTEPRLRRVPDGVPGAWTLAALPGIPGATGSVAVHAPGCTVDAFRWPAP